MPGAGRRRMEPLASVLTDNFLGWLPKATYPVRTGLHANSSFGLSRALPYARMLAGSGRPSLAEAIEDAARRWYASRRRLSGGLGAVRARLPLASAGRSRADGPAAACRGVRRLAGRLSCRAWPPAAPASLFTPAVVSDSSDGQIAHLHGLNLSRAWCWRRLAETLPPGDPRIPACIEAAQRHAEASLPHVVGDDYMVTHWLAAYAVLLFS